MTMAQNAALTDPPPYAHTQRGHLHHMLYILAVGMLVVAAILANVDPTAVIVAVLGAAVTVLAALCFSTLTVRDEGDALRVVFGPLPLVNKQFRYADITDAARDRTIFIDGWGVHWIPWRGWTYNLWGNDCVRIEHRGRTVRIGTDDAENLLTTLREKAHLA